MDWDLPEFAPAPAAPAPASDGPRAPLAVKINPGFLRQRMFENDRHAVAAFSLLLELQPISPEAYLQRGLAHGRLNESAKAVADYEMFLALTEKCDPRRTEIQFRCASNYHQNLKDDRKAIAALLDAADSSPDLMPWPEQYARLCNHYAWQAVKPSSPAGALHAAMRLARLAVELEPDNFMHQNTLGVALFRLGRYDEAVRCLEANLSRSGQYVAFDLYFMAMSYERLGERAKARAAFDRASALVADDPGLTPVHRQELAGFRAEAEGLLAISPKKD
jgi:tetratricopeptide (TPR) repeat protein